uniref:EF-hand domain-containing protein n=1 Tax=Pyrodinium bahamense TaxID=73915 RepID=A0A7S0B763_9DINO
MDIDGEDLFRLFQMADQDQSGEIVAEEFIEEMYRMKNADPRTATKFVKEIVTRLDTRTTTIEAFLGGVQTKFDQYESALERGFIDLKKDVAATLRQSRQVHICQQLEERQRTLEAALDQAACQALEAALNAAAESARRLVNAAVLAGKNGQRPQSPNSQRCEVHQSPQTSSAGASRECSTSSRSAADDMQSLPQPVKAVCVTGSTESVRSHWRGGLVAAATPALDPGICYSSV